MKILLSLILSLSTLTTLLAQSPEELVKRQARSVHLIYNPTVKNAAEAIGTVTVTETQTNSYFAALCWDCGYCGIQDRGQWGKILIFSVWDPVDPYDFKANPNNVAEELRARVLFADQGVDVARFGGEGTGARTITPYDWQLGKPVTVRITARPSETNRTAFACYLADPTRPDGWRKIAEVSTLRHENRAQGLNFVHSFVEDYWRNGLSATLSRRAEFSDVMTRGAQDQEWTKATGAYFNGDGTPSLAVDAGRLGPHSFFMQTGGATSNKTTRIFSHIK